MIAEKLAKEFEKIRTSLAKSKKLILVDIDKIDEKYRRLAQEEKKSLTESLGILNDQLKYYDNMLGGVAEAVEEATADEQKTEEEPVIQDTIFPENNEPEMKEEVVDPVVEEEESQLEKKEDGMTKENVVEVLEAAGLKNIETEVETNDVKTTVEDAPNEQAIEDIPELNSPDWSNPDNVKTNDDGWPQW